MRKEEPSVRFLTLGALMFGPAHGYEILQLLDSALGTTWSVGISRLYLILKNLEEDGLVVTHLEHQETRPSKRVVSLTARGRENFLSWVTSPTVKVRDLRSEFMAKLFFFSRLPISGGPDLVEAQVRQLEITAAGIREMRRKQDDPYAELVFGLKERIAETWIEWIRHEANAFVLSLNRESSNGDFSAGGKP